MDRAAKESGRMTGWNKIVVGLILLLIILRLPTIIGWFS